MTTRAVIEQAKGLLIARTGCTPEQAFQLLVAQSQHDNIKVNRLAAELLEHNIRARAGTDGSASRTGPPVTLSGDGQQALASGG